MQETISKGWKADDPILEVRDLSVMFDMDRGVSRVTDHVSLDVERGEILGVVGESGSGKSMFASAMLDAVVKPGTTAGDVTYYPSGEESVDVLDLSTSDLKALRWEEISMVFQGAMSSWNPTQDIRTHFEETLEAHGSDMEAGMERARELLSDLYLDPERVLDSHPHELSGGMKQRALIALSLVLEPEVLVMDEPTAALDLLMQRSILTLLEALKEKYDLTLVFITHDLPLVAELADRIAVMYAFEFVEVGDTEEILRDAAHPYTRALLNSTPSLETPVEAMRPIEGSSPDPVNVPEGCSYHPRCPLADETCRTHDPTLETGGGDTLETACFHWEESQENIPLAYDKPSASPTEATTDEIPEVAPSPSGPGNDDGPVLSLDDVEVHFDTGSSFGPFGESKTVNAVDGVSLDIEENDVVALVGESGCGKTTLGKTAIGLQEPTGGSISYRGQDVWDARYGRGDVDIPYTDVRRALQIIHQDPGSALNPNMTVKSILAAPLKRWQPQLNAADRTERILQMLNIVRMTPAKDYAGRYPHQLSGGEKQRVALVRALLMNPDVILADEAVSALDVSLRIETMDLLLELQELFGTSYLFVSHNLSNARYLTEKAGGRIGVMYLGKLVEIGPPEQIIENPQHPYTQVLKWATPSLDPDQEETDEVPVRSIDIPDPVDVPSGCRFHTRCPEAREACTKQSPESFDAGEDHEVACFRECDRSHEYWSSEPLED
jgi:peptide/nickel transport system ATP-binding protein